MSPLCVVLLLVATAEGVYLAVLLAERRRDRLVLERLSADVRATLELVEQGQGPPDSARPIGFRA